MVPCLWTEEVNCKGHDTEHRITPEDFKIQLEIDPTMLKNNSPNFRYGAARRRRFCRLSLYTGVRVNPVLPAFILGIQWNVWRCVTDLHRCLWWGHDHRWWWYRRHRSLHWYHRRNRGGLSGDGAVRRLTAVVWRRVHSSVNRLPGCKQRGQGAHGGVEVPMGLLGCGGEPTLPPWYPAELPGDKEGDPEQGQATRSHHQR